MDMDSTVGTTKIWKRRTVSRKPATPELNYCKGVERHVERYWKIQKGETIPDFDSRWIFPEYENLQ